MLRLLNSWTVSGDTHYGVLFFLAPLPQAEARGKQYGATYGAHCSRRLL